MKRRVSLAISFDFVNKCLWVELFVEKSGTLFFQALNKIGQSNYTQWLSGTAITYNDWKTGDPAAFASENCAGIE